MTQELEPSKHLQDFESIKHMGEDGNEFWYARELQPVLEYSKWERFQNVLNKAMKACENSGHLVEHHFYPVDKAVGLGSGASRKIQDYCLSRYACYLIVQNADPSKSVIANGQTYFAVQTRRQELDDDDKFQELDENEKRLFLRRELREHNKQLVEAAKQAGVESNLDFAIFQNHGYQGLYGGLGAKELHKRKGLKQSQKILDHMGSTEMAANLFRATQTEDKLRRDGTQGKQEANSVHFQVGQKVRQTIKDIGGTMPEDLPTPDESIAGLEQRKKKQLKDDGQ
ncbi:DNA damage-inducible protein D [Thiothrix fructosivorans]|jgi:DNA-damage-inducible protein D|uniref:DNA damage-inducible protein D n=1 Tax=Thiothrix fructosivorans TaxID=111770 RepID=A0A8B0SVS7_9GAMM|nr:DNA damage-inducible protein D [Thiothrix fructosivorans]MBO0611497.1 DNA damage-inducible protein D [Thiothrix fructosivorans]QTX13082.1 DNA damage-inducible protein D [Thiothrix fructosivorans]